LWNRFRLASLYDKCNMISVAALCMFFFGCSFSGGGHYLQIGPLTPRMFFVLVATLAAVPALLKNAGKLIRNPICILVIGFVVYLVICGIRGYKAGNRTNVLVSDLKGFAWLFLVPVLMVILKDRSMIRWILNSIILGSVFQALFVLTVNIVCSVVPNGASILHDPILDSQMGSIGAISERLFRIFTKSSPYMVFTCGLVIFRQTELKKLNLWYVLVFALCMNALLLSFTRSIYGCVFVVFLCAVLVIAIFYRKQFWNSVKFFAIGSALTLILVFAGELAFGGNYLNFAISRTFGTEVQESFAVSLHNALENALTSGDSADGPADDSTDASTDGSDDGFPGDSSTNGDDSLKHQQDYLQITQESDRLREKTQAELMQIIKKNPVFGSGLGASAPCRENGLDEYFYFDILARMGIVGLVLYLLPFGYILYVCIRNKSKLASFTDGSSTICGMVGFWAVTWFNPWMNAVLGIACYALCASVSQNIKEIE